MDTKSFLTKISPQRDEIVVCCLRNGIFWNRGSFADIDDAVAAIQRWDNDPATTVYYTVGRFADNREVVDGKTKYLRTAEKATYFKTLAMDIDCGDGKPYQTQDDALPVLVQAVKALGLPKPMVVNSGGGLHVYWPLIEEIPTTEWEDLSHALRLAVQTHSLQIDTSKIHDPTMVLRPVGSHHKKRTPHVPVSVLVDGPETPASSFKTILGAWMGKRAVTRPSRTGKPRSAIAAAVMQSNDLDLMTVAGNCQQLRGLIESGGELDAAGNYVTEPMWRASLGMAKYAVDQITAIYLVAGGHPDFDEDANVAKMNAWNGTGPTTCAEFDRQCPGICHSCPHVGAVKSPAQLNFVVEPEEPAEPITIVDPNTGKLVVLGDDYVPPTDFPEGYGMHSGDLSRIVDDETSPNGLGWRPICGYEIHIVELFYDHENKRAAFRMAVKHPITGWELQDHDISVLSGPGKEFASFLYNRRVFIAKPALQEHLRVYLMDYLSKVQSEAAAGTDFITFGWQKDGSFLCGEQIVNSPTGATSRRLKGVAGRYADVIKPHGTRDEWVRAMSMLNNPGTETIRSALLIACSGVLGPVAGNASMVLSIYSTETTTGKTLSLVAANSLVGTPRDLFLNKNDTANALFKVRGVLNNLPCSIDELTSADDRDIVNLAYDLSQGREKLAMDKNRDVREPVHWDGPTLITTNISLHQKFESVQANNDPLKARTFEIHQHDRTFIRTDPKTGVSPGSVFFDIIAENNGWAMPELVQGVMAMGGPKSAWQRGEAAFMRQFNFAFEPQERFYRTAIIAGWIMGSIGVRMGLFPFDVDATTQHLLGLVMSARRDAVGGRFDVFDVVGQYLQEHNDRLIEVTEVHGSNKEQVRLPAPERAVARVKIVYNNGTPVMPGSSLALNLILFKQWLQKQGDSLDRVTRELEKSGALLSKKDRVTMFKGCMTRNPGQTQCVVVNLNHPRFVDALTGASTKVQSPITLAVLNTATTP